MINVDKIRRDLDYISSAVRRDNRGGITALYFLWAGLIGAGFALSDLAPQYFAVYWLLAGFGGGLFSWWWGARSGRRSGIRDPELGRRYALHWTISGGAFLLCFLAMASDGAAAGPENFLLVAGLSYALAGVHLERPLLYSGLVMLAAYGLIAALSPPYAWTTTGAATATALVLAGLCGARR